MSLKDDLIFVSMAASIALPIGGLIGVGAYSSHSALSIFSEYALGYALGLSIPVAIVTALLIYIPFHFLGWAAAGIFRRY